MVFGVLAGVAGVSRALFTSAPATATANSFSTGSADLQIASDVSNSPGTYGTSIPGATVSDLTPGKTSTLVFWLKNNSSGDMELDLASDLANVTAGTLGSSLNIKFTCDNKTSSSTARDGETSNKTLTAWDTDAAEPVNQGTDTTPGRLGPNGTANGSGSDEAKCTMTTTLDPTSNSQGASASFDAVFTGTQV